MGSTINDKITGKINKTTKNFNKDSGEKIVKIVDNAGGMDNDLKLRAMDDERMGRENGGKPPSPFFGDRNYKLQGENLGNVFQFRGTIRISKTFRQLSF